MKRRRNCSNLLHWDPSGGSDRADVSLIVSMALSDELSEKKRQSVLWVARVLGSLSNIMLM